MSIAGGWAAALRPGRRWRAIAGDLALFAGALALYVKTLSPSVYTFDSAELAAGAYSLGIVHATGYPLYLMLAKLFTLLVPLGDIAYRVNLFSALCAALALAVSRRAMILITGSAGSATLAAALFGASYPLWSEAVAAEVYTLHILFLAAILWLALRWRTTGRPRDLVLFSFIFGLSFGNHLSTVLVVPGAALLVGEALRRGPAFRPPLRVWAAAGAAAMAGPLTYLYLPIRYAADPALNYAAFMGVDLRTAEGVLWMVGGAMFADSIFAYSLSQVPWEALRFLELLWQTFLGIGSIVAAVGLWDMGKRDRPLALALGLIFAFNALFYINYRVFDKATMFLPVFLTVSVWMAQGLLGLHRRLAAAGAPRQAVAWGGALWLVGMLVLNYPRADLSGNWITRQYAEQVFRQVSPGAFILGGWIDITPLEYLQVVEGARPDVTLFDFGLYTLGRRPRLAAEGLGEESIQRIIQEEIRWIVDRELSGGRDVYSLESNPILEEHFVLSDLGPLYLVRAPRP